MPIVNMLGITEYVLVTKAFQLKCVEMILVKISRYCTYISVIIECKLTLVHF